MDNNEDNNQELNTIIDENGNDTAIVDDEMEEIKFQKLNDEAMHANEKLLSLDDIIASPEHQLTIIYGDDSILNISKVGDIMNDMRPITTDKKKLSPSNILIPPTNKALKNINDAPKGVVSVDVYKGIIIPTPQKEELPVTNGPVQSKRYSNAVSEDLIEDNRLEEDESNKSISSNYSSEVIEANDYRGNDEMDEDTDENK